MLFPGPRPWSVPIRIPSRSSLLRLRLLALLAGLALSLPSFACNAPKGYAVPLGGAVSPDDNAIWERLVQLAGGKDAHFVVIALASEKPEQAAAKAVEALVRRGARAQYLPIPARAPAQEASRAAQERELAARIMAASGVFFTGGAQSRLTDGLSPGGIPTPMLDAICAVKARGGVVAGTSAGAAVMSERMFRDPPDTLTLMKRGPVAGADVGPGLGFVGPGLFVDQHFLSRGRIGRLLAVMHAERIRLGVGVDEGSGAIFHDGSVEAIGSRGIVVIDLADATSDPRRGALNLRGVRLHYLEQGDQVDLATLTVRPAPGKRSGQLLEPALAGYAPYYPDGHFYADFLGENTLAIAMARLMDSAGPDISGLAFAPGDDAGPLRDLGFEFRLYKGVGSRAWMAEQSGSPRYTIERVYLDVEPVRMANPLHTPWRAGP